MADRARSFDAPRDDLRSAYDDHKFIALLLIDTRKSHDKIRGFFVRQRAWIEDMNADPDARLYLGLPKDIEAAASQGDLPNLVKGLRVSRSMMPCFVFLRRARDGSRPERPFYQKLDAGALEDDKTGEGHIALVFDAARAADREMPGSHPLLQLRRRLRLEREREDSATRRATAGEATKLGPLTEGAAKGFAGAAGDAFWDMLARLFP